MFAIQHAAPITREKAILAGGCFWCTEAIFQRLKGVVSVTPGYAGGNVQNPSYEDVSSGKTGHAEAVEIVFDPLDVSYEKLLDVFWNTHDPTTYHHQGNDVGPQYRSVIFYHDERQKKAAEDSVHALELSRQYSDPIVTEIVPFTHFYEAEDYHRNYFEHHKDALYCDLVISPKITKLLQKYGRELKAEYQE